MADGGEGTFDGVRCADALPVHGGEVIEREELGAVLVHQCNGVGELRLVNFHEEIKGFFG